MHSMRTMPASPVRSSPGNPMAPAHFAVTATGFVDPFVLESDGRTRASSSYAQPESRRPRARTTGTAVGSTRQRAARRSRAEAMESHDVVELRKTISLAEAAGVPDKELVSAERLMNFEVNKEVLQEIQTVRSAVDSLAGVVQAIEERAAQLELPSNDNTVDAWLTDIVDHVEQVVWKALQQRVEEEVQNAVRKATQEFRALSSAAKQLMQHEDSIRPESKLNRDSCETASHFSSSSGESETYDPSQSPREKGKIMSNARKNALDSKHRTQQPPKSRLKNHVSLAIPPGPVALPPHEAASRIQAHLRGVRTRKHVKDAKGTRGAAGKMTGNQPSLLGAFFDAPSRRKSYERAGSILRQRPSLKSGLDACVPDSLERRLRRGSGRVSTNHVPDIGEPAAEEKKRKEVPESDVAPWFSKDIFDMQQVIAGRGDTFDADTQALVESIPQTILEPQNWGLRVIEIRKFYQYIERDLGEFVKRERKLGGNVARNLHVVTPRFIKPWTKQFATCGLAVVVNANLLLSKKIASLEELMTARVFVSHCWNEDFGDFVKTMNTVLSPDDVVWVCAISICQNVDIQSILGESIEDSPFWRAMPHCRRVAMLIDRKAEPFERAWCALEEYLATYKLRLPFSICMPDNMDEDAWDEVDRKLQKFSIKECKASQASDRRKIMKIIGDKADIIDRVIRDESTKACFAARVMKVAVKGEVSELDPLAMSSLSKIADGAGRSIIHVCAQWGRVDHLRKLVVHCGLNDECAAGKTPLHYAAKYGQERAADLLIKNDADVDARDHLNWTPLALAANNGKASVAHLLAISGADIDSNDGEGYTPLLNAAVNGFPDVVRLLLELRANLNAKDRHGHTGLILAAQSGGSTSPAVISCLATRRAMLDAVDADGCTALMYAAGFGHLDAVKVLVDCGANLELGDSENYTAVDLATDGDHTDVVNLLTAHMRRHNS